MSAKEHQKQYNSNCNLIDATQWELPYNNSYILQHILTGIRIMHNPGGIHNTPGSQRRRSAQTADFIIPVRFIVQSLTAVRLQSIALQKIGGLIDVIGILIETTRLFVQTDGVRRCRKDVAFLLVVIVIDANDETLISIGTVRPDRTGKVRAPPQSVLSCNSVSIRRFVHAGQFRRIAAVEIASVHPLFGGKPPHVVAAVVELQDVAGADARDGAVAEAVGPSQGGAYRYRDGAGCGR